MPEVHSQRCRPRDRFACAAAGGTFFGRLSSDMNDFRSNDGGNPVMRAASGTRTRCAETRIGATVCEFDTSPLQMGTASATKPGAPCARDPLP